MGLKAKFNLVMLIALLVGLALAAGLSWRIVHDEARREVLQEANIMMAMASAIRDYTNNEIEPLLADQIKTRFLPHTVPSWAAQTNLRALAKQFPDYTYKEAALNPTNPADKATDWESNIIAEFDHKPSLREFTSTRDTPTGPILSISRPIRITDKDCLTCHSTPSRGARIDDRSLRHRQRFRLEARRRDRRPDRLRADAASRWTAPTRRSRSTLAALIAVFAVTIVLMNLLLHFVIVKPIRRMSAIASEVSLGNMDAPEFPERGRDEIASLAGSFNRMRRSLANAMKILES